MRGRAHSSVKLPVPRGRRGPGGPVLAIFAARCQRCVTGTDLIARHDSAAGVEAARVARADVAEQLATAMAGTPGEALERAAVRCPSLRRYPIGMASPKVRTALRSGDIAAWDLDRQLAVAASLGLRARIVLEPA
jgi:hypothetical protein